MGGNLKPAEYDILKQVAEQLTGWSISLEGQVAEQPKVYASEISNRKEVGKAVRVKNGSKELAPAEENIAWYGDDIDTYNADVQWDIAVRYAKGDGVEQDYKKAFLWAERAGNQGKAAAQSFAGDCCFFGLGRKTDKEKAFEWYEIAAEGGFVPAMKYLGDCYYFGLY